MEKMREEFEAWYLSQVADDDVVHIDLWAAWKASRAALCVELPSKMRSEPLSLYDIGFNDGIDGAIECIEEAGVSHK